MTCAHTYASRKNTHKRDYYADEHFYNIKFLTIQRATIYLRRDGILLLYATYIIRISYTIKNYIIYTINREWLLA
jgi:hypothetical protein